MALAPARPWAKFFLSIETNTVKFINATIIIYISHKCIILKLTFRVGFGYEFKKLFFRSVYTCVRVLHLKYILEQMYLNIFKVLKYEYSILLIVIYDVSMYDIYLFCS